MAKKYLDDNGLLYFWQKIRNTFVSNITYDSSTHKIQKVKKTGTNGAEESTDIVTLATVATSGSYNDLSNKPTIPAAVPKTTTTPKMDGTAAIGSETKYAAGDHVHPTDTSRAPNNHASTATTYGSGTSSNYGHVKLSDATDGTAAAASGGTAATPKAVSDALAAAKSYADGLDTGVSDVTVDGTSVVTDGVAAVDLSGKVDKVSGKGLSTNDYTTTEKDKLAGIAAGAEVNQNAFSNVKVGTTTIVADGKTDTLELTAGSNISLTPDDTNDKVTIAVTGIASGAEVNQNAFSNVKVGSTTIAADTKTDTLELAAGSNITLTPDATNDKVTIAASSPTYTSFTGKPTANQTPGFGSTFTISQISQSTTGQVSGTDRTVKIPDTVASSSANGLMSSTDKDKLDGISGQTLDLVPGNNITITPNTTSGSLTITATDTTYSSGTSTELSNGTVTVTRVWTPKILHDYIANAIETAVTGSAAFQGTAPTTFAPTTYKAGYYWVVGTAGTYVGQTCEAGDMIFAIADGTSYSASNFDVVQTNLDITSITNSEIDTIVAA